MCVSCIKNKLQLTDFSRDIFVAKNAVRRSQHAATANVYTHTHNDTSALAAAATVAVAA